METQASNSHSDMCSCVSRECADHSDENQSYSPSASVNEVTHGSVGDGGGVGGVGGDGGGDGDGDEPCVTVRHSRCGTAPVTSH